MRIIFRMLCNGQNTADFTVIIDVISIEAKRVDDQDATRYKGKPWPTPHCVRWESTCHTPLPPKGGHSVP